MPDTSKYGFVVYNSASNISFHDLTRVRRVLETQLSFVFDLLKTGVVDDGSGTPLQVSEGDGLQVSVDAGGALIRTADDTHNVGGVLGQTATVAGLRDGADEDGPVYIHAALVEKPDEDGQSSDEGTADLEVFASDNESEPGAELLAAVQTAGGAIVEITDRRSFIPLSQLEEVALAIGLPYNPTALGGTIKARLAQLESQVAALQATVGGVEGGGLTLDTMTVSVDDATTGKQYVDNIKAALEAAIASGGVTRENPEYKAVIFEQGAIGIGLAEVHREYTQRSNATTVVIDITGDGSGGSVDDLNEGTATIDDETASIGP